MAPIIEAATGIVEDSGHQYHILLILADGQVINVMNEQLIYSRRQSRYIYKV